MFRGQCKFADVSGQTRNQVRIFLKKRTGLLIIRKKKNQKQKNPIIKKKSSQKQKNLIIKKKSSQKQKNLTTKKKKNQNQIILKQIKKNRQLNPLKYSLTSQKLTMVEH